MQEPFTTHLNRRLLENRLADTTDQAPDEMALSGNIFSDAALHARERKRLFTETPQPVAFSGELPGPNHFLATSVLDVPLLLTRDAGGELHAMINACTHRGAPLAPDGKHGESRALVCPFHGWSYQPDGTLRGRPQEDAFASPASNCGLQKLAVSERGGIIVVAPTPGLSQQQVDEATAELVDELASYRFDTYRVLTRKTLEVNANWKLINDLSLESYHFANLHRDSVAQMLTSHAVFDTWAHSSRWAFPLKSIADLAGTPQEAWPQSLQGSCTYTLYPGVMVIVNALGAQMIRAEPGREPGISRVTYTGMRIADCAEADAKAASDFGAEVFVTEDLPMAEACQRGLAATGQSLPLGRNEPLLQYWHTLWASATEIS